MSLMRSKKLVTLSANVNYVTRTDYKCYPQQSRNTVISPSASSSKLGEDITITHFSYNSPKKSNTIKKIANSNLEAAATKKVFVLSFLAVYPLLIDAVANSEYSL